MSELAEKDKLAVDRLTALFDDGAFTEIDATPNPRPAMWRLLPVSAR